MSVPDTLPAQPATLTRLSQPGQVLAARGLWGIGMLFILGLFAASLFIYPLEFQRGCLCHSIARIELQQDVFVISLRPESPDTARIRDGDVLLAIGDTPITPDTPLSMVNSLLDDGPIGSEVRLTVRTGEAAPREVTLTRSMAAYWLIGGAMTFGLWPEAATIYAVVLEIMVMAVFLGGAGLIAWRNSDDWMALYAAWAMVASGFVGAQLLTALRINTLVPPAPFIVISSFKAAIYALIYAFALLFPEGHFRPRWTGLLTIGFALWQLFLRLNIGSISRVLLDLVILAFIVAFIMVSVYRYRRFFSPVRRQQTKWVLYGLAVVLLTMQLIFSLITVLTLRAPREVAAAVFFIAYPLSRLVLLVIPLTFAFAALRYRLYDINVVINRSLAYGTVTILLTGVFLGGGFALQALLGQELSSVAFTLSIIAAALLFNPARKQARHLVDRYLYGLRFDLTELARARTLATLPMPRPGVDGPLTGKKLGPYDVLGLLGRGGMGEVYHGQSDGRRVALKVLPVDRAQETEFLKRFEREAQVLKACDHPGIVKMYDSGQADGVYFMALEVIEGRELSNILRERGPLPPDEVQSFARECAAALDYAHGRGLVHRDIKPSNIMLRLRTDRDSYEVVLMDFGVARFQEARTELTGSGAVGTIDYMAPEQIMAAKAVTHQADIYALGVVLYELLTGERPFKGSVAQVIFAHLQQPAPDPREINADIPSHIAKALLKALEKQPEDRFQTAGELAAALQASGG